MRVAASGPSVGVQVGSRTIDAWLPSMARWKVSATIRPPTPVSLPRLSSASRRTVDRAVRSPRGRAHEVLAGLHEPRARQFSSRYCVLTWTADRAPWACGRAIPLSLSTGFSLWKAASVPAGRGRGLLDRWPGESQLAARARIEPPDARSTARCRLPSAIATASIGRWAPA
jgi:hypothetical protein